MFCSPEKSLVRHEKELRTALQLDRRFSRRDLFAIAANIYDFGEDQVGVQAASQYFFRKNPVDLSVSEAALLAGLVRAPSYYSAVTHPDRALKRRNEVLDAMILHRKFRKPRLRGRFRDPVQPTARTSQAQHQTANHPTLAR